MARDPKTQKSAEGQPQLIDAEKVRLEEVEWSEDTDSLVEWEESRN